ncbi:hypothetical protein HO173_005994 [Letharia columbiana]|uniref:Fungal N-terminal domain-containing protein n=1 Tax=Letharia columbiana TaxID=112416 RepID=A0A8H6FW28_9LECA|nr:uncharacterized protein HO173_005994 [Letharia columbiana]KAF6235799.1 hypothetical protein HO173_005994 [Letharia columbiana]
MDPLSLSASIIAVLQLTGMLLSYINDVQNATKDQAQLAVEVSNIYSLLISLRFRVEQSKLSRSVVHGCTQPGNRRWTS